MTTSEYERLREQRQRENTAILSRLTFGLTETIHQRRIIRKAKQQRKKHSFLEEEHPTRKSQRIAAATQSKPKSLLPKRKPRVRRHTEISTAAIVEEHYTDKQALTLGSCMRPFPHMRIPKLFDVAGTLCHQCGQRSKDCKSHCNRCDSEKGQLCGPCLQLRYGENLLEILTHGDWTCPACRGFCNCTACRKSLGLPPVGAVLVPSGFASIAHWLVLTHVSK